MKITGVLNAKYHDKKKGICYSVCGKYEISYFDECLINIRSDRHEARCALNSGVCRPGFNPPYLSRYASRM